MAHAPIRFTDVSALEVLDSRGNPTVEVTLTTEDGRPFTAGVPSGASTGTREAVELRDGDPERYEGKGVTRAVGNVVGEISELLRSRSWESLEWLDDALIELDGTDGKSRLGANAILGVSMAAARAFAGDRPLWQDLAPREVEVRLPVPHFNVLNGGVHAPNDLDFQEFMLAPLGAPSFAEAVRAGSTIYHRLKKDLTARGESTGLGDEGGFAPDISSPEEVLRLLVAAIEDAGYTPGREGVAIAMDPASSEFHRGGVYRIAGEDLSSEDLIDRYEDIIAEFPVWSLEDGLAEDDWDGWRRLTDRLGDRVQLVGDDIFVTNSAIISRAIERGIANSALIKLNQIGTVTETLHAQALCREAGYAQMISHRSGETADTFIADLAVATGAGQIKSGAPARGERVAKYDRLLSIAQSAPTLPYGLAR
ncbi:MAG: phosphopyruvate hydratase [Actinomyces sp.]|jgi:enolase|nr:phosphopyruvate hydratase [Actinomyces sp.]MCI1641037.1 phosphopyruvate hydratase [Actinomyces sp.]MCI1661405.1 phosphopyruvate hydratase [Actinomyces sp.]MCI1690413.1 phosphopyruvate hydratase [Actinomyces sp.]MCI1787054.1 phosphopyruvate hydratase [Actinomyces sp.]